MPFETIDAAAAPAARSAAATVRAGARQLRRLAGEIGDPVGGLEWTGPTRDRVVSALQTDAAVLEGLAGDADDVASRLEAHASWVDRETARLDHMRNDVRRFVDSHPDHPFSVEFTARAEPPRWNTRWADLHRRSGDAIFIAHTPTGAVL